jgi:hypothetical protein
MALNLKHQRGLQARVISEVGPCLQKVVSPRQFQGSSMYLISVTFNLRQIELNRVIMGNLTTYSTVSDA